MDRFCFAARRGLLLAIVLLLPPFITVPAAGELAWSFTDHPHPTDTELTASEQELLVYRKDPALKEPECEVLLASEYALYQARYPGFAAAADSQSRYQGWKGHVASAELQNAQICLFALPMFKIARIGRAPGVDAGFFFCGTYSRPPANETERELAVTIDELIAYAQTGNLMAVGNLTTINDIATPLRLNPDVEYYLRKSIRSAYGFEAIDRGTSHLDPLIPAERRAFLDEAIAKKDFETVLATTAPCKPQGGNAGQ